MQEHNHASNATTQPAVPGIQATAQTDASGAPQQTGDDDLSEIIDCLCVMNEYGLKYHAVHRQPPDHTESYLAEEIFGSHRALRKGPA